MVVESVRVHMLSSQHVVILKESERDRYLPIWIGPSEANAIAMRLQGLSAERPLTHDLMVSVLSALDSSISRVVVTHVIEGTFHARLYVETAEGDETEIDSRTSDAIAVAVRTGSTDLRRRARPRRGRRRAGAARTATGRREAGGLPRIRELARRRPGVRREARAPEELDLLVRARVAEDLARRVQSAQRSLPESRNVRRILRKLAPVLVPAARG